MRYLMGLAIVLAFAAGVAAGSAEWQATARLQAAPHEVEDGYFLFGSDSMIVARPGSSLHGWLSDQVGREVTLTLQPAGATR